MLGHALDLSVLSQNFRLQETRTSLGGVELDGSLISGNEKSETFVVEQVLPTADWSDGLGVADLCLERPLQILKEKLESNFLLL